MEEDGAPPRNFSPSHVSPLVPRTPSNSPSPEQQRARPRSRSGCARTPTAAAQCGAGGVMQRAPSATRVCRSLSLHVTGAISVTFWRRHCPTATPNSDFFRSTPHSRRHTTRPRASRRDSPASLVALVVVGVAQRARKNKKPVLGLRSRERQHRSHIIPPRRRLALKQKL